MTRPGENKAHCMVVIGTRPEAIKMAPVVQCLRDGAADLRATLLCTGQHIELVEQVLSLFQLRPDFDLRLMEHSQSHSGFLRKALAGLEDVFRREQPDLVLAQGDTNTVLAATLSAFHLGISTGHVEAGLRTDNLREPFPEEANRRLTSVLADLHFAPTTTSRDNLLRENVEAERVFLTGNPVVDALQDIRGRALDEAAVAFPFLANGRRVLLVTAHRRENHGAPIDSICRAVGRIVDEFLDTEVVWPVHPHPKVKEPVLQHLAGRERVHLTDPLGYATLIGVLASSTLVLTDSGGLQEEAPAFGKPVLTLRANTERPEGVSTGNSKLVGTDEDAVVAAARRLLTDAKEYQRMAEAASPYGDGRAAERIVACVRSHLGLPSAAFQPFQVSR